MKMNEIIQLGSLHLNEINKNGRIYTEEVFKNAINDFIKKKENIGIIYGEFGHPDSFDISLKNVTHIIENVKIKPRKMPRKLKKLLKKLNTWNNKKCVNVNMKFLNTNKGNIAFNLVKELGKENFVLSPRGIGTVNELNKEVDLQELLTFDFIPKKDAAF